MSMSLSVNVHRPEVQKGELGVHRLENDQLVVTLATDGYAGSVILFTSDEGWQAIVDQVAAFRAGEHCAQCGWELTEAHGGSRFCSDDCERASEQPLCTVCGDSREWCKRGPYDTDLVESDDHALDPIACPECGEVNQRIDVAKDGLCYGCHIALSTD